MNDSLLDNPIWNALDGEQAQLAERRGDAARFQRELTALAGLRELRAIAELAAILQPGEHAGVFLDEDIALPPGLARVDRAMVLQMVHDGREVASRPCVELTDDDAPAMRALAAATRPGPFGLRTHTLGTFLGIKVDGALAAMAGQRMRLPGMMEVSAVCTDPAHLGRGHAATLIAAQLALIAAAGRVAFLHVKDDNARAIAVYERLGFRARRRFDYHILVSTDRT
jgi:ribosomal protein S18 acetylase RimI-like enzyme